MRKLKYIFIVAIGAVLVGCNDFLETKSETILPDELIFSDVSMIKGLLSNMHREAAGWDRSSTNVGYVDAVEANGTRDMTTGTSIGLGRNTGIPGNGFRIAYERIRRINVFLESLKGTDVLTADQKLPYEGEARFVRAYTYWTLVKYWGGVVIVGDESWIFTPGITMDEVTAEMALARSTEKASYDYILSELDYASSVAPAKTASNWDHYNKFIPLALKARVAMYAASIAQYTQEALDRGTNLQASDVRLASGNVGIAVSEAPAYWQKSLDAAETVIRDGGYALIQAVSGDAPTQDYAENFLNAVMIKSNNTEVIWALDHVVPTYRNGTNFTNYGPYSHASNGMGNGMQAYLNTAELFGFRDGSAPQIVKGAAIERTSPGSTGVSQTVYDYRTQAPVDLRKPIVYQHPMDVWQKNQTINPSTNVATVSGLIGDDRDPRMYASIVVPGSTLNLVDHKGEVFMMAGNYRADLAADATTDLETLWDGLTRVNRNNPYTKTIEGKDFENYAPNGPMPRANETDYPRTGLLPKKWMSFTESGSDGNPSTWELRIRLAEIYLIAAEAIGEGGAVSTLGKTALDYLNMTRVRAGVAPAAAYDFETLVLERNAEFTFEDQRIHDQRRWRIRHELFPIASNYTATWMTDVQYARPLALYPFRYLDPTDASYQTFDRTKYKWVFVRAPFWLLQGPYYMNPTNYYYSFDDFVFNRNQKFTGNPGNKPDSR